MTLSISCSSPVVSLALIDETGGVLFAKQRESKQNAAETCLRLLEEGLSASGLSKGDVSLVIADIGPGSFIGVRVGATIAKTLAYALKIPVAGITSFDLIDPNGVAVVPSRKGEYFIRRVGAAAIRSSDLPGGSYAGYGSDFLEQQYPDARLAASQLSTSKRIRAEELVPEYLIEPSISIPKKPYPHANP